MRLSQLTKELPQPADLSGFLKTLQFEVDDRSCAIMGSALVEDYLTQAIKCRLIDPGQEIAGRWFSGQNAPFGTFSAKIQLGLAIGIYGPQMHKRLGAIKDIRNAFAHRALPLQFDHLALLEALTKMAPFLEGSKENNYKLLFSTGCIVMAEALIKDAAAHAGRDIETSFP